ncbi:MAG TPA: Era-like GTP-binding protein, partial [bacterium]|nr:Era-like GTP-binding protein [bacterium]
AGILIPPGLAGFASGTGVALLFDGIFQGRKAVLFPWIGSLVDTTSLDDRFWLLLNGILCIKIAQITIRRGFSDNEKNAIFQGWQTVRSRLWRDDGTAARARDLTMEEIESRVAAAEITGDGSESVATIRELLDSAAEHRDGKLFNVTMFGQVNAGKTAIIRAIVREFGGPSTARAGETRGVTAVPWQTIDAGEFSVRFIDTPGLAETGGIATDEQARETAGVADLIVYVLESDVRARDAEAIAGLMRLGRPLIVALNKTDLYTDAQRLEIIESILNRFKERLNPADLVPVCAEARAVDAEILEAETGSLRTETRVVPADVTPLTDRIAEIIRQYGAEMHNGARGARIDRIRHAWFMAAVPEEKRRKVTALINAQVAIASESARNVPGTLRDILNRLDMNAFIKSIGELLGSDTHRGRYRFFEACLTAMERECGNGNNPEYLRLQNVEYAVARTVEL